MTSKPIRSIVLCCVALLLAAGASLAQTTSGGGGGGGGIIPPPPAACEQLVRRCAEMTDQQLWDAAFLDTSRKPASSLGTCYFHDRSSCPTCACPYYVKISYYPSPSGFDGGTGCLQTREEVLAALRLLCSQGKCGCPKKDFKGDCILPIVWGKDPITGTCCQYGMPCEVPDGWPQFNSKTECEQH